SGTPVGLVLRERPSGVAGLLALLATGRPAILVTPIQPDAPMCDDVRGLRLAALIADRQDWQRVGLRDAARDAGTLGIEIGPEMAGSVRTVEGLSHATTTDRYVGSPDVALTILTSGTTGPPKRVPLSYAALDLGARPRSGRPAGERGVAINALPLVSIG